MLKNLEVKGRTILLSASWKERKDTRTALSPPDPCRLPRVIHFPFRLQDTTFLSPPPLFPSSLSLSLRKFLQSQSKQSHKAREFLQSSLHDFLSLKALIFCFPPTVAAACTHTHML